MTGIFANFFGRKKAGTQQFGLIGKHISYSLSPVMHNACYREMGIDADYQLYDMDLSIENAGKQLFKLAEEENLSGFNVTVPYKIMVKEILESSEHGDLDESAQLAGAVNTVKISGSEWTGFSTDGEGFYYSLKKDLGLDPAGKEVLILGAGGAGNTICMYLAALKEKAPQSIYVYDMDNEKTRSLYRAASSRDFLSVKALEDRGGLESVLSSGTLALLVNATPVGTRPEDDPPVQVSSVSESAAVYDLVYAHTTELIRRARKRGLSACGGSGMLAAQGAVAAGIWLDIDIKESARYMRSALAPEEM